MDVMIDHWERERPDLDASSLAIIYRNPFFGAFSVSRSRISVTSCTLKARPENLVVATAITEASPFPRHGTKTPRECPAGRRRGQTEALRRRGQAGLAARKEAGGGAVPAQDAPKRSVREQKSL